MWMPSERAIRDENVEVPILDWETLGRAIRECVLDALVIHVTGLAGSTDDPDRIADRDQNGRAGVGNE